MPKQKFFVQFRISPTLPWQTYPENYSTFRSAEALAESLLWHDKCICARVVKCTCHLHLVVDAITYV